MCFAGECFSNFTSAFGKFQQQGCALIILLKKCWCRHVCSITVLENLVGCNFTILQFYNFTTSSVLKESHKSEIDLSRFLRAWDLTIFDPRSMVMYWLSSLLIYNCNDLIRRYYLQICFLLAKEIWALSTVAWYKYKYQIYKAISKKFDDIWKTVNF